MERCYCRTAGTNGSAGSRASRRVLRERRTPGRSYPAGGAHPGSRRSWPVRATLLPASASTAWPGRSSGCSCGKLSKHRALHERRDAWKVCRKSIHYYDPAKQLKPMREEGLLGLANFSCCQDVLRRLDKTFQAFFVRVRRGEKPGFPRFRSFRRYDSITFPSYGDGCRLLEDGKLRIQGTGLVKVQLHRPVEGEIKTVTIKRDVNHWYVCFSVERDSVALPESSEDIGMDVGLDSFVALSNGMEIDNPRHLKRGLAHLRRAQRRLSRCKRGSHRRRKAATLVAKAHRKIRNQRAAFHHDLSRWLVERYGLIAVEDFNIKGLY